MTPVTYHTSTPSTFVEGINIAQSPSASSPSTLGGTFISAERHLDGYGSRWELQCPRLWREDDKQVLHQGLYDQPVGSENYGRDGATRFDLLQNKEERIEDQEDRDDHGSPKWVPSKIRILRKIMSSNVQRDRNDVAVNSAQESEDQKKRFSSSPSAESELSCSKRSSCRSSTDITGVRVCSDCNTTKTPLWRSGPRGPKSLCNACGIRQRKARRALATEAAAAANGGTIRPAATSSIKIKVKSKITKRSKNGGNGDPLLIRRGCKIKLPQNSSPTRKNDLRHEDFSSRILDSKHYSAYKRVFPQDEREAAMLLMALSCGLVHG